MFSSAQHFFEYEAGYPTGGFGNELSFDWPPVPLPPFHPSSSSLAGAITPPESHIYQPTSRLYERRLYFAQETARAPGHLPNLRHSASFSRDNTGSVLSAEEQREAQVHYVPKDVAFLTKGNSTRHGHLSRYDAFAQRSRTASDEQTILIQSPTAKSLVIESSSPKRGQRQRAASRKKQYKAPVLRRPPSSSPPPLTTDQKRTQLPPRRRVPEKKHSLACHFCRGRKISCGSPPPGSADMSCNQCARRSLKCEYPTESRRGMRNKTNSTATMAKVKKSRARTTRTSKKSPHPEPLSHTLNESHN